MNKKLFYVPGNSHKKTQFTQNFLRYWLILGTNSGNIDVEIINLS